MDAAQYLKFFAALIFVLGLMGGLAIVLKKLNLHGSTLSTAKKTLKIVEILPLDARRRLMLIQRGPIQHLVILGANSETVLEANIKPETEQENNA